METGGSIVTRVDTVPYNHFDYLLAVAKQQKLDLQRYFPDLFQQLASNPDAEEISADVFYRLIESLLQQDLIPALGAKLGSHFSLADYGVLGYACICCATVGQSLKTFFRFQQLVGSADSFSEELLIDGEQARITICCSHANAGLNRFDSELAISQWLAAGREYLNGEAMFDEIYIKGPRPHYSADLERQWPIPVHYDKDDYQILFPTKLMQKPLSMANSLTADLCQQQCQTMLQELQNQGGLVEQVRRLIIHQPGGLIDPEQIAVDLNLSYRSLRRRLAEEGTSFKEIHNQVRMRIAKEYLRSSELSTQEIAYLLGYAEVTNFHRAFKKLHDLTPGQYRQQQR